MGLNSYYYDGLQPKMSAGMIKLQNSILILQKDRKKVFNISSEGFVISVKNLAVKMIIFYISTYLVNNIVKVIRNSRLSNIDIVALKNHSSQNVMVPKLLK